ncbi:MAG TPA: hypothetical protein VM165_03660, partial [Planctomycetaceae bacterium]|nr:hypothetical protein [Planctomycetaceae bacterium]
HAEPFAERLVFDKLGTVHLARLITSSRSIRVALNMTEQARRILPKDALSHVTLGDSFAQFDEILRKPGVYVRTPAFAYAESGTTHKTIFVGRRGTGKTALSRYLERPEKNRFVLAPHVFGNPVLPSPIEEYRDVKQRPFHSLILAFKLAFLSEVLSLCQERRWIADYELVGDLRGEQHLVKEETFDFRLLQIFEELRSSIQTEKQWLKFLQRPKRLDKAMSQKECTDGNRITFLIDGIDEDWDGSDPAVILLMALLHASVQLNSETDYCRILVFLRENIFERVRAFDNEFARLETWIVSLDWTKELLLEMVERRLQSPFNTKPSLGGETWNSFFEDFDGKSSFELVAEHCQQRPRDVLTYCDYAIEGAKAKRHTKVDASDLIAARQKFSDSRLKDVADEYAENYSQIGIILSRFYGLGKRFTISGLRDFIAALSADPAVKAGCQQWFFSYTAPERFAKLLYDIGFLGVVSGDKTTFRTPGWRAESISTLQDNTVLCVHPTYVDALQLSEKTIASLDGTSLREAGLVLDQGLDLAEYQQVLQTLLEDLKTCAVGKDTAADFENIVGGILQHCFLGRLANIEPQVRDISNTKRRDWIASVIADMGFWAMIKGKYGAVQVIWECKNFMELEAEDFRQIRSYLNDQIGRFGIVCFRGEIKKHYYQHLKEMNSRENKLVLLLNDKDLSVFLRQAQKGKHTENHIQERFDEVLRSVS